MAESANVTADDSHLEQSSSLDSDNKETQTHDTGCPGRRASRHGKFHQSLSPINVKMRLLFDKYAENLIKLAEQRKM